MSAQVLSADAFSLFEEKGIFHRETGTLFLTSILQQGGSEEPAKLFKDFRGREPDTEALLRYRPISPIKRFVAGAVCPRCAKMDTIRVYRNEIREYRECVKCDYKNGLNLDGSPEQVSGLTTKVNQDKPANLCGAKVDAVIAQPIKFDPKVK